MKKIFLLLLPALLLGSCSSKTDQEKADELCTLAETRINEGMFQEGLDLLDSLKKAYPQQIQARKQALFLSRRAIEGLKLQQLTQADSLVTALQIRADSLQKLFTVVKGAQENFYAVKGTNVANAYNEPGLHGRVNLDGSLWLIATSPKAVGANRVVAQAAGKRAETGKLWSEGPSVGTEALNLSGHDADTIGQLVYSSIPNTVKLSFAGKGSTSMSISARQAQDVANAYWLSQTLRNLRIALLEQERLNRSVETARSQAAKTYVTKDSLPVAD